MDGKLYVVYSQSDYYYDDYSDAKEKIYNVVGKYFTNRDNAEEYAEYLDMTGTGDYFVDEVECGDDIDVSLLIFELKEAQRVKELANKKKNRAREVENLALYHSNVTGSNYGENLAKFKEMYADYIENGR